MLFCIDVTDVLIACVHWFQGRVLQRNAQDGAGGNSEVEKTQSDTFFPSATPHYIKTRFSLRFWGSLMDHQASVLQSQDYRRCISVPWPDPAFLFCLQVLCSVPNRDYCSQHVFFPSLSTWNLPPHPHSTKHCLCLPWAGMTCFVQIEMCPDLFLSFLFPCVHWRFCSLYCKGKKMAARSECLHHHVNNAKSKIVYKRHLITFWHDGNSWSLLRSLTSTPATL